MTAIVKVDFLEQRSQGSETKPVDSTVELRRYALVLAIYLNTRGCGFVLFEGHMSPFDWGMREIRGPRKHGRCVTRIIKKFDRYLPDVVVLQGTSPEGAQRARRIADFNAAIAELAKSRGIPVYLYSRDQVRAAFDYLGCVNKHALAEVIAKHIPALERYVPPRKPWMSENARMGIFDAAALGLRLVYSINRKDRQAT
ncbi:hypothetical protein [Bradyrhizobium sp. 2S1]|uniref:hypothetical protein n=1 Tax=Bradyrhizobium sp. 2S1 TaxID=1404429 RepID=UPI00140D1EC8|nr:hypothetical protein [Bradyrhizobium sp. 2S1]MCK7673736.1 hypothetical protein [Bradyrhizobium sp. 2S1]